MATITAAAARATLAATPPAINIAPATIFTTPATITPWLRFGTVNTYRLIGSLPLWVTRRAGLAALMKGVGCSIWATQECTDAQGNYLWQQLGLESREFHNLEVAWDPTKFDVLDVRTGTVVPTGHKRYVLLVELAPRNGMGPFWAGSTHFPTGSAADGVAATKALRGIIATLPRNNGRVVLGGDYNDDGVPPEPGVRQAFLDVLRDLWLQTPAAQLGNAKAATHRSFGRAQKFDSYRIDANLGSPTFAPYWDEMDPTAGAIVLTNHLTDHNIVVAQIQDGVAVSPAPAPPAPRPPRFTADILKLVKGRDYAAVRAYWVNLRMTDGKRSGHLFYVQAWLSSVGLYKVAIDGYGGAITKAALEADRRAQGFTGRAATGPVTVAQLASLRLRAVKASPRLSTHPPVKA